MLELNKLYLGDALEILKTVPDNLMNCCVTSPPYWNLRDYGIDEQLGREKTPEEYVQNLVKIFREVKRILRKDGTTWLNLGDTYYRTSVRGGNKEGKNNFSHYTKANKGSYKRPKVKNLKPKDLCGIPWMVAFALRADGWYLRQDIIWSKPNPMPESVTDRCTKSHEYIFLLSKSAKYYYNAEAIKEDSIDTESYKGRKFRGPKAIVYAGARPFSNPNTIDKGNKANGKIYEKRNKHSVWTVTTKPYSEVHFAVYPQKLIEDCIKAGCPEGGIVLDPFAGTNTTGIVARKQNKNFISIELNPAYIKMAERRMYKELGIFK